MNAAEPLPKGTEETGLLELLQPASTTPASTRAEAMARLKLEANKSKAIRAAEKARAKSLSRFGRLSYLSGAWEALKSGVSGFVKEYKTQNEASANKFQFGEFRSELKKLSDEKRLVVAGYKEFEKAKDLRIDDYRSMAKTDLEVISRHYSKQLAGCDEKIKNAKGAVVNSESYQNLATNFGPLASKLGATAATTLHKRDLKKEKRGIVKAKNQEIDLAKKDFYDARKGLRAEKGAAYLERNEQLSALRKEQFSLVKSSGKQILKEFGSAAKGLLGKLGKGGSAFINGAKSGWNNHWENVNREITASLAFAPGSSDFVSVLSPASKRSDNQSVYQLKL